MMKFPVVLNLSEYTNLTMKSKQILPRDSATYSV
jgi:hypothetical protein